MIARIVIAAAAFVALGVAGCGRGLHDEITDFCRGQLSCGIDTSTSTGALPACEQAYLHPDGGAHEQCLTTEKAACLGNCFHTYGCAMYDVNDPCSCGHQSYDCPQ